MNLTIVTNMAKRKREGKTTPSALRDYVERLRGVFVSRPWVESPRLMRVAGQWCGIGGPYLIPGRGAYMGKEYKEATREQYAVLSEQLEKVVIIHEEKTTDDAVQTTEPDNGGDSGEALD